MHPVFAAALAAVSLLLAPAAFAQSGAETPGTDTASQPKDLGPDIFLAIDGEQAYRVEDWIGAPVILKDSGDSIGEIETLILDEDGQTVAAIVGVGGFLGLGEKRIAVNLKSLQASWTDGQVELAISATREQIDNAQPIVLD